MRSAECCCANCVWKKLVTDALSFGQEVRPRGLLSTELVAHQTVVDMNRCVLSLMSRKLGYKFLAREAWWILSGRNDLASIVDASRHIANYSDDGVRFNGAYGPKVIDQMSYVIDCLVGDVHSRQSVMNIWRENPRKSKDIPCTLSAQFVLRPAAYGLQLHCIDTMRSSDIWLGWPYDVFNFSMISASILIAVRNKLHEAGAPTHLELGKLYLTAGSQHLYKEKVAGIVPYSLEEVEACFKDDTEKPYAPFNPDRFETADELAIHLHKVSCGLTTSAGWLSEFNSKN